MTLDNRSPLLFLAVLSLASCGEGIAIDPGSVSTGITFEQFKADTYREPNDGVFIVDGDTVVSSEAELRDFYERHVRPGQLVVHLDRGAVSVWPVAVRQNITYCVSRDFGGRHAQVVRLMAAAVAPWEAAANVKFVYVPAEDARCNTLLSHLQFQVAPAPADAPYFARAFFPTTPRRDRFILVHPDTFAPGYPTPLGIMRHEVGHALGFRHEHVRYACPEDSSWQALTPYDSASVMIYPTCGGESYEMVFSALDKIGAIEAYGPAAVNLTADFDGDRRADRLTITPTLRWYVALSSGADPASIGIPRGWQWLGMDGRHVPVVADFDGDGRADRAIVSRIGQWFLILSSGRDPATIGIPWGWQWAGAGMQHIPVVADYDGDRRADRAIFAADTSAWFVILSSGANPAIVGIPWGSVAWTNTYEPNLRLVPAVADYDGDGRTDRALVDPAAGEWWVGGRAWWIPSGWAWPGMGSQHVLAIGDYDGDRKADRAIVDPSSGAWWMLPSSNVDPSVAGIPWGWQWPGMGPQHQLVVADYDGDGRTDRAITAGGRWYVILASGVDPASVRVPWGSYLGP